MSLPVPARAGLDNPLAGIQYPVRAELELVSTRMWEIVADDNPLIVEETRSTLAIDHAAVVELIHLATLVHDDSVDHSVLRRGMPTVNAVFSHQVSVIMGDYLYSQAVRHLVGTRDMESLRVIAEAAKTMTMGELWQLSAVDRLQFSEAEYFQLNHAKTASLMSASCEVGAICGAPSHREPLARFGERLGMAFQVADDLLDYIEGQEITGKPSGADLRERKVTLPLIAALRRMPATARREVERFFETSEPGEASISRVISLVVEADGIEYARRKGELFAQEAEEIALALPDTAARAALLELVGYVLDRRW
jgi:octaprenyl-diphosphate synthase